MTRDALRERLINEWHIARDRVTAALYSRDRVATRQAQQQERDAWMRMIAADVWRKEEE